MYPFYANWQNFSTRRPFHWLNKYDRTQVSVAMVTVSMVIVAMETAGCESEGREANGKGQQEDTRCCKEEKKRSCPGN